MKKIKVILISLIVIVAGVFALLKMHIREPLEYLQADTKAIVAMENINDDKLADVIDFCAKAGLGIDEDMLSKNELFIASKLVSKVYMFVEGNVGAMTSLESLSTFNGVIIIKPATFSLPAVAKEWNKYFEKEGDVYKVSDSIAKNIQNENDIDIENIYAMRKSGLIFIASSREYLDKYLNKGNQNTKQIEEIVAENDNSVLTYILNTDIGKEFGVTHLICNVGFQSDDVILGIQAYLDRKMYAALGDMPSSRKIAGDISGRALYISMKEFDRLFEIGIFKAQKTKFEFLASFMGINLDREIKNIDGEILVDLEQNQVTIPMKDVKISNLGRLPRINMDIDVATNIVKLSMGNVNSNSSNASGTNIEIKPKQFLYGKLKLRDLNFLNVAAPEYADTDIFITGELPKIKLEIRQKKDTIANTIANMAENK